MVPIPRALRAGCLSLACLLALILFGHDGAHAQAATLSGRVTGGGSGLPGVVVTATRIEGGAREEATSGEDGAYRLEGLAPGAYRVAADRAGFETVRVGEVVLEAGATRTLPIEIHLYTLQAVVVTASTTNAAIASHEIDRWQAADLADVFRTVPSVSVGGSLGIAQKVYLRGVEDTHLNVSVDGAMQTGTLFHHIGRVGIEPELLEQVEVQAGAGEATAGFGALGGAIRFRTKDADDLLAPGQKVGGLLKGGYFTNAGHKLSASGFGRLGSDWGVLGSYVSVDRRNVTDGAGRESYGTAADQALAFIKVGGKLGDRQRLTVSYEHRDEKGEFGPRPNWPVLEDEPLFPGSAGRRTAVANYRLDLNPLVALEATAYSTRARFEQDRHDRWGVYGASVNTLGFDLRNTSRFGRHEVIYGVEHRADEVVSEYLSDPATWAKWAWDPSVGRFREKGSLVGAYLQDHIRLSEPFLLSVGLRFDSYDLDQLTYRDGTSSQGVSGNVGMLYRLSESLSLSAGVAQALRGKEVGDAFTLERRPGRVSIDPELEPERATNREAGIVFDDGRWRATASAYRMSIEDVIHDQLGGGPAPQNAVYYENIGTLESEGVELGVGFRSARLQGRVFFTTFDAELNGNVVEGYEHIGLANAVGDKWDLSLTYAPHSSVELGWNLISVRGLDDVSVLHRALEIGWIDAIQTVDKPGYTVHDLAVRWRPVGTPRLTLDLAVQNLLDRHYRDHSSVADYTGIPGWEGVAGLYEAGRDIRLSIGTRF